MNKPVRDQYGNPDYESWIAIETRDVFCSTLVIGGLAIPRPILSKEEAKTVRNWLIDSGMVVFLEAGMETLEKLF